MTGLLSSLIPFRDRELEESEGNSSFEMRLSLKEFLRHGIVVLEVHIFKRFNDFSIRCYWKILLYHKNSLWLIQIQQVPNSTSKKVLNQRLFISVNFRFTFDIFNFLYYYKKIISNNLNKWNEQITKVLFHTDSSYILV